MGSLGRFQVLGQLGQGGMGSVLRARDPHSGREVALKLLLRGAASNEGQRRRFLREGRALAKLSHPNLLRVHEVGQHEGQPFLVTELVEGRSLADSLARFGTLDVDRVQELGARLARALAVVHEAGLLHRDVKPENVLLDPAGDPILVDFGLVKDVERVGQTLALTRDGAPLGTPSFWAPEQASGQLAQLSPQTDIYCLGGTLYAALTGAPPHRGASMIELQVAALEQAPPSIRSQRAEVPPALEAIVLRCLAKDPAERFPSAQALAEALERAPLVAARGGGRRRWGGVAALALGCLAAAGLGLSLGGSEPPSLEERYAAAEALAEREGGEAARATFLELAEAGHAPAITRLAKQALLATPPDPAATERWLSRANAAGDVKAGEALGTLLFYGHAGLKQDRSRGLELLRAAAEAGRPNAALIYGSALCDGQGVAQDQEEGARWVQRAAEQGHPPALRTLGRLYRIGRGVGEDPALARRYLREAVAAGDMPAATKLAQLLAQGEGGEKDEAEALRLFRQAAEADPPDPLACCGLGELYRYGRGTPVDRVEAERWYRAAAELGMIEGKVSLAGMLIEPQDRSAADLARAEELLREPVAQGNRLGLANMAALYFVRRDMREGFRWSLKAAEAGDLQSMHNVAFMLSEGKVVPPDDRAAVRWYQRAAELGHAEAPLNLASHYFHGRGVERDLHAVARCYELALERLEPGANRDAAQSGLKDIRRRLARGER